MQHYVRIRGRQPPGRARSVFRAKADREERASREEQHRTGTNRMGKEANGNETKTEKRKVNKPATRRILSQHGGQNESERGNVAGHGYCMVHAELLHALLHAALHAAPPDAGPASTQKTTKPGAKSRKASETSRANWRKLARLGRGARATGSVWEHLDRGKSGDRRLNNVKMDRKGRKKRGEAMQCRRGCSWAWPGQGWSGQQRGQQRGQKRGRALLQEIHLRSPCLPAGFLRLSFVLFLPDRRRQQTTRSLPPFSRDGDGLLRLFAGWDGRSCPHSLSSIVLWSCVWVAIEGW